MPLISYTVGNLISMLLEKEETSVKTSKKATTKSNCINPKIFLHTHNIKFNVNRTKIEIPKFCNQTYHAKEQRGFP
jgi:hypothetical protein